MRVNTMKFVVSKIAGIAIAFGLALSGTAFAAKDNAPTPHYPLIKPKQVEWSFAGPFGTWDIGQLQRGLQVYSEVCAACHSLNLVAYRSLADLGYSEDQIKAYAAEYEITDGPDDEGEMFERPAKPADRFVGPYPNVQAGKAANNGAPPPDFSLLAKSRIPKRGFPYYVFDVFTMYVENGPDYLYSLLTGYVDAPAGYKVPENAHYNPYFISGSALAMASPLSDELIDYTDGSPQTVDQYARDVAAFMMWAAEPDLINRKALGFKVMIFLLLFSGLLYLTKKRVWSSLKN